MDRKDAIKIFSKVIGNNPIISANGFISRDLFNTLEKETNFYMIGSMGLASSIGLGISLKKPKKRVFIFDGDGNILMNLGSLVTISTLKPKNLIHVIFDNKIHESTGGQPTFSNKNNISDIAKVLGYTVFIIKTKKELADILSKIKNKTGPIMLHIQISKTKEKSSRVTIIPKKIKFRFMNSIN